MTSYKKLWEDADEKLTFAVTEAETLRHQLSLAQDGMIAEFADSLTNADAKEVLRLFVNRVENRGELVLLMRVLSKIND